MNEEAGYSRRVVKRRDNAWQKIAGFLRRLKSLDRRRAERFILETPVSCVFLKAASREQAEHDCLVYNISETGALLMTEDEKLIPGEEVVIKLAVPGSVGLLEARGGIVRTYRKHAQLYYHSAVRFKEGEAEKLRSFVGKVIAHDETTNIRERAV